MNENTLWTRHAQGDEIARQLLLNEHLGLVHFVARQVARGIAVDLEFDELVSAGTLGLMSALDSFEVERGLAFSTFATPRIRGAIIDELRRQDHVPRSVRRKARDINAARETLGRSTASAPSDKEVAAELGVDLPTLWRWQADLEGAVRIPIDRSSSSQADGSPEVTDIAYADESDDVEEKMNTEMEVTHLREAILGLKEQERTVLSLYYFENLRLHEIATILQLTESRVSQIRTKALGNLRHTLAPLRANVA